MSKVMFFSNDTAFCVRVLQKPLHENGEIWFVIQDILDSLGYQCLPAQIMQSIPENSKSVKPVAAPIARIKLNEPGAFIICERFEPQAMLCLNEQGALFFLQHSDKPKALQYQTWLAEHVISRIRQ